MDRGSAPMRGRRARRLVRGGKRRKGHENDQNLTEVRWDSKIGNVKGVVGGVSHES